MELIPPIAPDPQRLKLCLIGGSQYLYEEETRNSASQKCSEIAESLGLSANFDFNVEYLGLGLSEKNILPMIDAANSDPDCVGVILFAHTFVIAGEWTRALRTLTKPVILLDIQTFEGELGTMEWSHMNLHQGAHAAFEMNAALLEAGIRPMYVSGKYEDVDFHIRLNWLGRIAMALTIAKQATILSWGPTMRHVRLTYADSFKFQEVFGPSIVPVQPSEIMRAMALVEDSEINELLETWKSRYDISDTELVDGDKVIDPLVMSDLRFQVAMQKWCAEVNALGFTTSFENLGGSINLPGAAVQDMMMNGYGFGPEGHFVVCFLTWLFKTICTGMPGYHTTMIEDYVLRFPDKFIAGHMLELCPSACAPGTKPRLVKAVLKIGSYEAVRLVFDACFKGDCTMTTVAYRQDGTFRMIVGEVESLMPPAMPNMPAAKAFLRVKRGELGPYRENWMRLMGPHHSALNQVPVWVQATLAEQFGIPCHLVTGEEITRLNPVIP